MIRTLCIAAVAILMTASTVRYVIGLIRGRINPAPSTWIIFMSGVALSFVTYMVAENRDVATGILNTMDVLEVGTILAAVMIWGKRTGLRFSTFEKWYLAGVVAIAVYALVFGDAWGSNLFTQILIGSGYIPMVQKMVRLKRNTESFSAWTCSGLAGVFALVPAIVDGNLLAVVYAGRTVIMIAMFMSMMAWYEWGYPRHSRK